MTPWIRLLTALVWPVLVAVVIVLGRGFWGAALESLKRRIERGDSFNLGIAGFNIQFDHMAATAPRIEPKSSGWSRSERQQRVGSPELWLSVGGELETKRTGIGRQHRGVHLVHVAVPSEQKGQVCDLFVSLTGWNRSAYQCPDDLSDVAAAEFWLGPKFDPQGVKVTKGWNQPLGFVTSAYAPVICTCRVIFDDGESVVLSRYLDFESASLVRTTLGEARE